MVGKGLAGLVTGLSLGSLSASIRPRFDALDCGKLRFPCGKPRPSRRIAAPIGDTRRRYERGEVAERLNAPVLKTGSPSRGSGVRISPSPPNHRGLCTLENQRWMHRRDSIVYCSGQAWKLWVMILGVPVVVPLIAWAVSQEDTLPLSYRFIVTFLVTLLAAGVLAFPCLTIRCPACRARWFWLAISKKHDVEEFRWLFTRSSCPVCHSSCRKIAEHHHSR